MKRYSVFISAAAEKDMLDVYRYMKDVLPVPETGILYLEKFKDAVEGLQVFPGRFKKVFTINGREIRFCPVGNYLIFIVSAKKENAWRSSVSCILEEIMKRCFDVWRMNRIE